MNATDERLGGANLVYLRYCSSDGWMGDAASEARPGFTPSVWAFRGAAIVSATVAALVRDHALGALPATQVLYGGASAGARGAMVNADAVAAQLQAALGERLAAFGVLLDSPLWVDVAPLSAKATSFADQARAVLALAQPPASVLGAACASAFPGALLWKCLFAQYRLPLLTSRLFLHAYAYDQFQLGEDTGVQPPYGAPQLAYAEAFRNMSTAVALRDTAACAAAGACGLLMPACYKHCNTLAPTFHTARTAGRTLQDRVASWFWGARRPADEANVANVEVEACVGFNCGTDCPALVPEIV
jgi:hypothetical protein